jgi:hypothetical protein
MVYAATAAAVVVVLHGTAAAQAGAPSTAGATAPYTPPRTADGQPDIQGVWDHKGLLGGGSIECGYDINLGTGHHQNFNPPEETKPGAQPKTPPPPHPCGPDANKYGTYFNAVPVPLQPWARAKKDEMFKIYTVGATSVQQLDPVARCLPVGLPRTHSLVGLHHFFQPPGYVVILDEQSHQHRSIPVDGRPHVGEPIRLWMGDSRGRWEGNILTVETTNFNDKSWLDAAATIHSDALKTVERFTILDANTIKYEIVFEDPKVLTKPFSLTHSFVKAKKGDEVLEEECLEGNRLENYGFK